ncbi:MAG: MATE family efflux transporter [Oscillospiraceae bacterium]|nr:MATE family efflux transporter [Oscillospiraceae bacterium]
MSRTIRSADSKAIDMTRGNILKCMLLFTLPVVIGNLLQELYSFFDTMIVGRTLGVVKLASVGITGSLVFFAMGFTIGNAAGCSVITSQRLGAGDKHGMDRSIAAHYVISLLEAVILTTVFVSLAGTLLKAINTGSDMYPHSLTYITIIFAGIPATILYNMLSSILRAVGDSRTPLFFLAFSSVLNIFLDLLFILSFGWDVAGAAIATVMAQLISGLACFIYTRAKFPELIPKASAFRGIWPEVGKALKIGIPMGLNMSVTAAGIIIVARVLNSFGSSAVAAQTICIKIQRMMETVMFAVSTMVSTFVGQNYGARRFDRINKGISQITLLTFVYLAVFSTIAFFLRRPIIDIFIGETEESVMVFVEQYLRWMCPTMFLLSFLHVFRGANIGLGNGNAALIAGISELIARGVFTPLLAPIIGFTAICVTGPLAWFLCAVLGFVLFTASLKKLQKQELTAQIE